MKYEGDFYMPATEPIRNKAKLRQLAGYCLQRGQVRNYTMIIMGVHTALRISDLLHLTWPDVYDGEREIFRSHITLTEKKTGKHKTIALNKQVITALKLLLPHKRNTYIFANNRKVPAPISRVQAWRIIKQAADAASIAGSTGGHVLRKTFGYFAWKAGVSPVVLMDIYNHSSYSITRRYLGVSQDDRDEVYLSLALF